MKDLPLLNDLPIPHITIATFLPGQFKCYSGNHADQTFALGVGTTPEEAYADWRLVLEVKGTGIRDD